MRIVKVNSIDLVEKDMIELKKLSDFKKLYHDLNFGMCFDLNGSYYLLGSEVSYLYIKHSSGVGVLQDAQLQ